MLTVLPYFRPVVKSCALSMAIVGSSALCAAAADAPAVAFEKSPGSVAITIGGEPFATFTYEDERITRPYFAHVRAPGGVQVTRNHPPVAGQDSPDHDTFHPGIWMSFGDISGSDFWRIKAPVKFDRFTKAPEGGPGRGSFTARYSYRDQQHPDETVCHEDFRCEVRVVPEGYLVLWDSTFTSDKEFAFGDQEEMGLGFRIATPLRVETDNDAGLPPGNGKIVSSSGAVNEDEVWGNTAEWCDYTGEADGQQVGITLFCHPKNFRPSWFHARDYGLLEANPFGRAAFGKGEASKVVVKPGESLRLRYGVLIHAQSAGSPLDLASAYREYQELAGK